MQNYVEKILYGNIKSMQLIFFEFTEHNILNTEDTNNNSTLLSLIYTCLFGFQENVSGRGFRI